MNAHPAGPLHAGVLPPAESAGPHPRSAAEFDALAPAVWPRGARRTDDGAVALAGVDVRDLADRYGTPLFVVDEADFRARAAEFAAAFGARSVHYAAKAFLSVEVARWVAAEGLSLDVCSGGELAVALRAGFPADRIALHGNNKSVDELVAAVEAGVGYVVLDSLHEIARLDAVARERGVTVPVMVRLTVGVEAHTHEFIATAHEDQKFGFSISGRETSDAAEAVRRVLKADALTLVGLHSHIGSQIFDTEGFEVAAHRVVGFLAQLHREHGPDALADVHTLDLGGGFGIAYRSGDDPVDVRAPGRRAARDRRARVRGGGAAGARDRGRAGPRDRRAGHGHPLRGGHPQGRAVDRHRAPVRQRGRWDERQHPHGALRRGVRRPAGLPGQRHGRGRAVAGGRQALRVGRHRRSRLLAARGPRAGRPAGGGRHRGVLLLDGQ